MKAGDYPYPADEFDAADARGGPRGVHRAPRSRRRRLLPFLVVLVVFPLLAYGAVTWLSDWQGLGSGGTPAEGTSTEADEGTTEEEPVEEDAGEAEVPVEPETEEPVETTPPPPPVDLATPVEVFNATSRSGLAGGAAERVEEAGFTAVSAGNWQGDDLEASTVYYATPDQVTTAELVAQTLGITAVQESAEQAPEGVVVVLAADYED
ncbi:MULTISPECIES: LytR C-terminal domain-containing protein [unclassified Actinotalea]|uniref:LytR C-terminal domain-containing protein n=1 Tax=unclassified Actinotalea TaxID=2638618 RepID=UPI0015F543EF|nr:MULTISPECIES: LytR C-terminal domain-containing protein [unclassified Actinotalea]